MASEELILAPTASPDNALDKSTPDTDLKYLVGRAQFQTTESVFKEETAAQKREKASEEAPQQAASEEAAPEEAPGEEAAPRKTAPEDTAAKKPAVAVSGFVPDLRWAPLRKAKKTFQEKVKARKEAAREEAIRDPLTAFDLVLKEGELRDQKLAKLHWHGVIDSQHVTNSGCPLAMCGCRPVHHGMDELYEEVFDAVENYRMDESDEETEDRLVFARSKRPNGRLTIKRSSRLNKGFLSGQYALFPDEFEADEEEEPIENEVKQPPRHRFKVVAVTAASTRAPRTRGTKRAAEEDLTDMSVVISTPKTLKLRALSPPSSDIQMLTPALRTPKRLKLHGPRPAHISPQDMASAGMDLAITTQQPSEYDNLSNGEKSQAESNALVLRENSSYAPQELLRQVERVVVHEDSQPLRAASRLSAQNASATNDNVIEGSKNDLRFTNSRAGGKQATSSNTTQVSQKRKLDAFFEDNNSPQEPISKQIHTGGKAAKCWNEDAAVKKPAETTAYTPNLESTDVPNALSSGNGFSGNALENTKAFDDTSALLETSKPRLVIKPYEREDGTKGTLKLKLRDQCTATEKALLLQLHAQGVEGMQLTVKFNAIAKKAGRTFRLLQSLENALDAMEAEGEEI